MRPFFSFAGVVLVLFFVGEVQSSSYRGGIIAYKPNPNSPYSVDFKIRLSFRRSTMECRKKNEVESKNVFTAIPWTVTRYKNGIFTEETLNAYCSDFNIQEDWSEAQGNFTFTGGDDDDWWNVRLIRGDGWFLGFAQASPYNNWILDAKVKKTISGAFNNSSPVSNLPLTVYLVQGIPSVLKIPVQDPDGDSVRCRVASSQECHEGICTYFPHGVLDEGNCTLSYNGNGSAGQLFAIILKLEDFPSGTTQFDSSNILGSVDLQFVVHIENPPAECSTYTELNTADRAATYKGTTNMCDNNDINIPGWYRFMGDAGTTIATSCVDNFHCGTENPVWMKGSHPTQVEGIVTRSVCFSDSDHCCSVTANILVRNCGEFYVYELVKTPGCYSRYCGSGRNLKTRVTCEENFMQIDLIDQYFPGLDWRSLHLKNTTCRATKTSSTMRLRAPLDGCGVTYVEHDKKITFMNEVRDEHSQGPGSGGNPSARTRENNLVIPFYCEYGRENIVSASFRPSKKSLHASEGSFGNFTFTMDLYQASNYSTPYAPSAYPVVVYPNQPLWVQYEVKNANADLVVFAENCRATTSTNPDSLPQHVFLEGGCIQDPTMAYTYDPYSKVQRFSIKSFRFVYSNTFLVYLHCELLVCHRSSTNSRCTLGCITESRGRRVVVDGSKRRYDVSVGPLKGTNN